VVLASGSPRRRDLLTLTGWQVRVKPISVDESPAEGESGEAMTRRLALAKVQVQDADGGEAVVLAADTTVVDDGALLGKPVDAAEARLMLRRLRGRRHVVVTSIAARAPDGTLVEDTCLSSVPMRAYADDEVERYVASGGPLDKAGGYGIQDGLFEPVDMASFSGCFANVMGLPLCHAVRSMRRLGLRPPTDVPAACQAHTHYACDVYPQILGGVA
jgi:MAF protein